MIGIWIALVVAGVIGLGVTTWVMRDEYFHFTKLVGYTLGTGLFWGLIAVGIAGVALCIPSEPTIQRNVAYEYTDLRGNKGVAKSCRENASGVLICETTNHTTVLVGSYREVEIKNED